MVLSLGQRWTVGLLLWLTGIPKRVGYAGSGGAAFLTDPVPLKTEQYAAEMYHDLLQGLGLNLPFRGLNISVPKSDIGWAEAEQQRLGIKESGYILIHGGSSLLAQQKGIDKIYPVEKWQKVIADLRQPGLRPPDAPKRVTAALRDRARAIARAGDIFITRHDDALSNLFLPGSWPHAALYLGGPDHGQGGDFLEARKDGVRYRPLDDTLQVDAFIILRPPLGQEEIEEALRRARDHAGKPYDFAFDFRRSDRLACTEVVYRAYHGIGNVRFDLIETAGRRGLPAEELIQQALQQGFRIIASAGIGSGDWLVARAAELALHQSRCGL